MRQQRHNDTRVIIATEEPTRCPELADLADVTFIHRSLSPAGLSTLHNHLAGAHTVFNSSTRTKSSHEQQLIGQITRLRTGESFVFCPAAHLSVNGNQAGNLASSLGSVLPLGNRLAQVKIRRRLTADRTSSGEPAELIHTGDVPMFVVEADEQAPKEEVKETSYREVGVDYDSTEQKAYHLRNHISFHLNEILRPLLIVDDNDEAWTWKELTRMAFRGLEKKFGLPENDIQYYPMLCRRCCEILDQSVVSLDSCTPPNALVFHLTVINQASIKSQLVKGELDKPDDNQYGSDDCDFF